MDGVRITLTNGRQILHLTTIERMLELMLTAHANDEPIIIMDDYKEYIIPYHSIALVETDKS